LELDAIAHARASCAGAPLRASLGVGDGGRLLLCLGTIEPRKSQGMLVEAFARVAERHPDTVLALVGEIDEPWCAPYVQGIRDFVERSGLARRVHVLPVTPRPYPWHAAADLVVCASDVESLPRSVTEAMAFGTPVVSTRVFGVTDVIEDGVTGYLCEPRDAGDLASALDRALTADAAELSRIAAAGADLVARRHDPDAYADRVFRLLSGLARDPRANPGDLVFGTSRAQSAALVSRRV
jgi:glycosyltransferase involved in cell wall biosynthesis